MEQNNFQDLNQRTYEQKVELLKQTFELAGADEKVLADPIQTATLINQMPDACFRALDGFLVTSGLADEDQKRKGLAQMMIKQFVGNQSARA